MSGLYEADFHLQPFVAARAISLVAVVAELDGAEEELGLAPLGLFAITLMGLFAHLQQGDGLRVAAHEEIAQVFGESVDEVPTVESLLQHLVEKEQAVLHFVFQEEVCQAEIVI